MFEKVLYLFWES